MPLYEYECTACHRRTEKIQKFSDAELTVCPHCGGPLERTITAAAISFKGGGWYKDGYGLHKPASSSEGSTGDGGSGGSDKGGSDKGNSDSGGSNGNVDSSAALSASAGDGPKSNDAKSSESAKPAESSKPSAASPTPAPSSASKE